MSFLSLEARNFKITIWETLQRKIGRNLEKEEGLDYLGIRAKKEVLIPPHIMNLLKEYPIIQHESLQINSHNC